MPDKILYFAYGSNMSSKRLQARVPSAEPLGRYTLRGHDLRFHKEGADGSSKCDAYKTSADAMIHGVLFSIDPAEERDLDAAEGFGHGYDKKEVQVWSGEKSKTAFTYVAIKVRDSLKPYSWYVNHVLVGAREFDLPEDYIQQKILRVAAKEDDNHERDARERAIHE